MYGADVNTVPVTHLVQQLLRSQTLNNSDFGFSISVTSSVCFEHCHIMEDSEKE